MARLRVGVDVGGTFTDIVVWDEESERLHVLKTPSVPAEPAAITPGEGDSWKREWLCTYEDARGPKELRIFPADRPGSIHCQWDAPTRAHAAMFSFLRRYLG